MTVPGKRQDAAETTQLNEEAHDSASIQTNENASSLVLPELQIWDYIGNQRVKDLIAIREAMRTICEAALAILGGSPRRPEVLRVEEFAALSKDRRYQRLIFAVLTALREGDEEGLEAARSTAVLIKDIVTESPWYKPENLDKPWYPKTGVWRPKNQRRDATRQEPGSSP